MRIHTLCSVYAHYVHARALRYLALPDTASALSMHWTNTDDCSYSHVKYVPACENGVLVMIMMCW